jgi:hypothetical protein
LTTLGELPAAVLAQHRHGVPVQGNGTNAGGGLRVTLDDLVAGGGAVTDDEQHPVLEVDLAPAQSARFAPP